jgi:predicted CXXCH cytochrome family protein
MFTRRPDITVTLTIFLILFLIGCSPKVASIFFDGVPQNQDSIRLAAADSAARSDTSGATVIASTGMAQPVSSHPPYKLKKCTICHTTGTVQKLTQPQPGLCYLCHDDFSLTYKYVHGPASAGYCTSCHAPHAAANEKLLIRTGQQLCLFCHDEGDLLKTATHGDIGTRACTDCHNPHGSDVKNLLKPTSR